MGKMPYPLPPPRWETGEGAGARRRRQIRRLGASGVVRGRGKRERVKQRFDSPTWLGSRWSEAAGHRELATVALGYSGGSVRELRERRHGGAKLGVGAVDLGGAPRPYL